MKRIIFCVLAVLLHWLPSPCQQADSTLVLLPEQYAEAPDSAALSNGLATVPFYRERGLRQGETIDIIGKVMVLSSIGLAIPAAGLGTFLGLMTISSDSIVSSLIAVAFMAAGVQVAATCFLVAMAGYPVLMTGEALKASKVHWQDARYYGPGQKRMSLLLELSVCRYGPQIYLTPGYHVNQHLFLGGGASLAYLASQMGAPLQIPLYGHARVSFGSGMFSPYIGVSPGIDLMSNSFYGSAEAGVRFRLSENSPRSGWAALEGKTTGQLKTLAFKIGWSL